MLARTFLRVCERLVELRVHLGGVIFGADVFLLTRKGAYLIEIKTVPISRPASPRAAPPGPG